MTELISLLIREVLQDAASAFDTAFLSMLDGMLHVERLLDDTLSTNITVDAISKAYSLMYTLAAALVVLKFLFKGFQIYILWRDGDADASPQDMIVGSIQAVVAIAVFPILYDAMTDITIQVSRGLLNAFRLGGLDQNYGKFPFMETDLLRTVSIFHLILLLIFTVLMLVLNVKMIARGFELLVLRVGVPIACVGLVDSDLGVFKGYMQILYKTMFTSIIQIVLMSLAFRVAAGMKLPNLIFGIALVATAFSTPVIMQQVLVPTGRGGGGLTSKVYTASMAARAIRGLVGK